MRVFITLSVFLFGFLSVTSGQQPIGGNCDKTDADLICGKNTKCTNAVCMCDFNYRPGKESDAGEILPPKPNIDCISIKCRNTPMCTEYFPNTVCRAEFQYCTCDKGYERDYDDPGCRAIPERDDSWIYWVVGGCMFPMLLLIPMFVCMARRRQQQQRIVGVGVVAFVAEEQPPPRYTQ